MDRVPPAGFPDGAGGGDPALRGAAVHVPPDLDWEHGDPGCCALLTTSPATSPGWTHPLHLCHHPAAAQQLLSGDKSTSFAGCVARCYFFSFLRTVEFFLLTCMTYDPCAAICNPLHYPLLMNGRVCVQLLLVFFLGSSMFCHEAVMSFDRYMAICHPLRYGTIMNGRVCFQLVLSCWVMSFLIMVPPTFMVVLLPFCGPNVINHFYCDTAVLLQLSCGDTGHLEVMIFFSATVILLGTLTVTIVSYGCIISTIMRIPSTTGRKKAFSTCSAHLLVVVILYSSSTFRYLRPGQRGVQDFDKVVSFLYCVVVPLFNPYIYALRNEQMKEALKDACGRVSKCLRFS
ncbi:Olfactory receptor 6T1 [Chelonia mydas]|uniref:Olfactory receptor 6T1 n=1 Tax=Chelonia mydas TaxID=8469 RepID=M7AIM9_CHEMY|nr:Olfactory receptor 6T1 [Chelonia mydas]